MTHEPFDRDLRATLDKLMAEPAPATLRARVERTLATEAGSTPWPSRLPRRWLAAALVVAVIVVAPFAISLATRQPGVAGQPSPSVAPVGSPSPSVGPSSSPAVAGPTPSPSGITAAQIGLPVVDVSQDVVRKTRVDTMHQAVREGGPLTGPYLYQLPQGGTGTSYIIDIGGGSIRTIDPASLPLGRDESIAAFDHDGNWVAMLVTKSNPAGCRVSPASPQQWRIEVAPMGSDGRPGAWREVTSGAEQSGFRWPGQPGDASCASATLPAIALSGDDLAWSMSSSGASDAGSNVTVVSLATRAKVASFRSVTRVLGLWMSPEALAWVESTNVLDTSTPKAWAVMEARLSDGVVSPVDIGTNLRESAYLPQIALDGTAVVAAYFVDADSTSHVVRVDGGHTEVVSTARLDQVRVWRMIWADKGRVVLECESPGKESSPMFLAVWTADGGLRTVTVGGQPVLLPPEVTMSGDWVTWFAIDFAASAENPDVFLGDWTAIPIDALAAPAESSVSPGAKPSPAPASPSPTLPPYLAMPVISVPGLLPATTRVADPSVPQAGGELLGPYVYQQGKGATISVVDAGRGSVRAISPPLLAGEGIRSIVWSRDWLALVAASPLDPCGVPERGDRTDWRILAVPLQVDGAPAPGVGFRVVASGASTTPFLLAGEAGLNCAHPKEPVIALDGALLAFALPADGRSGSAVTVRLLRSEAGTDWSVKFTASRQVLFLAVSQVAVAWVEAANSLTNGGKTDWSVQEAAFGDPAPAAVWIGEPSGAGTFEPIVLLDGAAVLANRDQFFAGRGSVVRVDAGTLTTVAPESPNRQCLALGATIGHVVLECIGAAVKGDTAELSRSWLAEWSPGGGLRAIGIDGVPLWVDQAWVTRDRLIWSVEPSTSTGGVWLYGSAPLADITAMP